MKFKNGVIYTIPGVVQIMMAAEKVYAKYDTEATITSLMDGRHKNGSKHYRGDAVDLRIWAFNVDQLQSVCADLRSELGNDYDVVLESDHIHVEYDPDG